MTRLVVVGGGITGLVAARTAALAGAEVAVVDPGPWGGKLQATAFDGGRLDEAADAFLARVPDGVELCRELRLEGDLVSPAVRRAYVWSRGGLHLLPEGQLLGVPTDLDELAGSGVLSPEGVTRVAEEPSLPSNPPTDDVTIGAYVRARLGDEAAERLVDPLVGGINAGDTDHLSLAATVPQLDAAARAGGSLIEACRRQRAAVADPAAPVFFAPRRGMGALSEALVEDLGRRSVDLVAGAVTAVEADGAAWTAVLDDGRRLGADAVVLALPAGAAAPLLAPHAGRAATLLAAIPYASVALVSLAVDRAAIDRELDGSGFLVPRVERRLVTACSWTSSKWPHLAGDGTVWLAASVGRDGDDDALGLPDEVLVDRVLADLRATMALHGRPVAARVSRWPASFPQYRPGHLDRVAALDAHLDETAPGLVVAGAALRGLGVPACIRQGGDAAARALTRIWAR